jgi:hypothetical protein
MKVIKMATKDSGQKRKESVNGNPRLSKGHRAMSE